MGDCSGTLGPSARAFLRVSPVVAVGLDVVGGEDLAGGEFDDGDGGVVGDGEDAFAGVGVADAEVVHASGSAQAHLAEFVEQVVAQPVVTGAAGAGGRGLGQVGVDAGRSLAAELAVGALGVVEL